MFRSKMMVAALTLGCALASGTPAASASLLHKSDVLGHAAVGGKTVKLSLHNTSAEPLHVTIGEQDVTIEPGKTVEVKALVGAKIVNVTATKSHAAGEVLTQVSKDIAGATLRIG